MLPGLDHNYLMRFAARYVPEQDAEDVVQTAYLNILQRPAAAFRNQSRYSTWALSIVKNAAIDAYRRANASHRSKPLSLDTDVFDGLPTVDSPHEATALAEALDSLCDPDFEVIEAYISHGSWAEAAASLSLSRSTFHRRLALARTRLKELL